MCIHQQSALCGNTHAKFEASVRLVEPAVLRRRVTGAHKPPAGLFRPRCSSAPTMSSNVTHSRGPRLTCGLRLQRMTAQGQSLPKRDVLAMSVLPLIAPEERTSQDVSNRTVSHAHRSLCDY